MKTNPFRDFFYFHKGDRRAIVALGCIAVFAIGVLLLYRPSPQPSPVMGRETVRGVGNEPDGLPIMGEMSAGQRGSSGSFDPNTVDSLTLIGFGMKAWKVKNFLHYRAAGKVFRSAEDMGNTYGWTAEDVAMLKPYVRVGERYRRKERKHEDRWERREQWERKEPERTSNKFHTLTKVDVNEADTAMLRRIPGVGKKISDAIVRYRQRLGGFHSVNQLLDIKIVSPELLEWFTVSSSPDIQRININKASFQALNSHPYISYEQTKALLQYLRLYGEVKDEETLLSTGIFTKEDLERLRPYIAYE
ncbi:MAG: helix-hairpin-helix domain-containing protein [Bacteroidaceae bacterium]|nr:helix-hairpin-helix domain-containing protein [Bacteroidaceae bacterium]